MKTIVLFFSLILSLLVCSGQNLVQEGKLWSNTSIGTMPGSTYESYSIKFMGDTTINGIAYKKIMKSKDELNANWSSFGYIREETTTRKVFVYNKAANKDILLYDFSLEEGDSILTGDGHSYAKVTKVTNAAFGSSPVIRKQIYFFEPSGNTRWIEGIGSTWGILEGLNSFFTTGATASLVCYHENNELIYHNPRFSNCYPKISDPIIVNAGNDTTYCVGLYSTDIPMGLKINIQNGVAPYTYAWECKVPKGNYSFYTASDFLNDTTALSPSFTYPPGNNQWVTFTLHVTDSENNSGKDSIRLRFSKFGYLLGYPGVEINKGDSILLSFSSIGGGIEPLKFHYQPEAGLSNPDSLVTWAKPEVSTTYDIIATDSCGCVSEPNTAYYVMVMVSQELPDYYMGNYSCSLSNCSKNQLGQYDCVNTSNHSLRFEKTSNKYKIEVFFEDNSHFVLTQKNDSTFTHSEFPYISAVFYDADSVKLSRVHSSMGYSTYKGKRKTTNIDERLEALKIKATPNPFNNQILIENINNENPIIQLLDMNGKPMNVQVIYNGIHVLIKTDALNKGLYILKIIHSNSIHSYKMLKL